MPLQAVAAPAQRTWWGWLSGKPVPKPQELKPWQQAVNAVHKVPKIRPVGTVLEAGNVAALLAVSTQELYEQHLIDNLIGAFSPWSGELQREYCRPMASWPSAVVFSQDKWQAAWDLVCSTANEALVPSFVPAGAGHGPGGAVERGGQERHGAEEVREAARVRTGGCSPASGGRAGLRCY